MDDITTDTSQKSFPFHNLFLLSGLVHGFNKSWMYLSTILLLIFGYVLFQSIAVMPLMGILLEKGYTGTEILRNDHLLFDSKALGIDRNIVLAVELGMFVFAFFGFLAGIKLIHKKTLTSIITGYEKFRYRRFWFAFSVWSAFIVLSVIITLIFSPGELTFNFNPTGFTISVLIMIVAMPLQTGLEELVFRGYLIQGLSQVFKNGLVPLIITSLLFGSAHMDNPEVKEYGWPIMLTYYTSFALFLGCLTLLDEGLELAFGIHFANNIVSSMLLCSEDSVVKTYSLFDAKRGNAYTEMIAWLCMATLVFMIFWLRYRWKNFKLIIK